MNWSETRFITWLTFVLTDKSQLMLNASEICSVKQDGQNVVIAMKNGEAYNIRASFMEVQKAIAGTQKES